MPRTLSTNTLASGDYRLACFSCKSAHMKYAHEGSRGHVLPSLQHQGYLVTLLQQACGSFSAQSTLDWQRFRG